MDGSSLFRFYLPYALIYCFTGDRCCSGAYCVLRRDNLIFLCFPEANPYNHMKFILGTKKAMSQMFDETGAVTPITLIDAGPVTVLQERTAEKEGYRALQVGFGTRKHIAKPQKGHFQEFGNFRYVKEFRLSGAQDTSVLQRGTIINASIFSEGDIVSVRGISKGRGFQGVVKRHGFHGGPRTHGQKHSEREPGSIGATAPQKVLKGTRMAGRMGGEAVVIKHLRVMKADGARHMLAVSGAVPGARGTLLEIIAQ